MKAAPNKKATQPKPISRQLPEYRTLAETLKDAAREMSHAFFAEMLAGSTIHTADPERASGVAAWK